MGILLTLIVLAAVGAVGFRIGAMQNNSFVHPMLNGAGPAFGRGFDGVQPRMQGNNFHNKGFEGRGFDERGFGRGGQG